MLRFLWALFGRRENAAPSPSDAASSPRWREAPTRSWRAEVGGIEATMTYATCHSGFVAVVGELHYQAALRSLANRQLPERVFLARFVVEPDNP